MTIGRGDAVALTRELVRTDSRNPSLVAGAPGEVQIARVLAEVLSAWGFKVEVEESAPGRPNVVARAGEGRGRSLLLNGHLDTVGVEGMVHSPFGAEERDGRMFGRGSADMKSGVAAMCAAAARAVAGGLAGEVIIGAVADEEYASLGTRDLVERGVRADAAIVTEPTQLTIMPAHRGFVWIEVELSGRAAHGSRYDIGIDAITHAGLLLAELDRFERQTLTTRTHRLLGHASLHASTIDGGIGMSTYPDRCVVRLERRTLPGEHREQVMTEIRQACERVRAVRPSFTARTTMMLAQEPSDVAEDAPIVRALSEAARRVRTQAPAVLGMTAWTDAALLNDGGIPAICFGPGDISLAHAAEEFVPIAEIEQATDILTSLIADWCGGGTSHPARR